MKEVEQIAKANDVLMINQKLKLMKQFKDGTTDTSKKKFARYGFRIYLKGHKDLELKHK